MLYNASSIATGGPTVGEDRATGHGEPARLSLLKDLAETYNWATTVPSDDEKRVAREAALGLFDVSSLRASILTDHMFGNSSVTFANVLSSTTTNTRYQATQREITASIDAWLRFLRAAYATLFRWQVLDDASLRNDAEKALTADFTFAEGMVVKPRATRSGKRLGAPAPKRTAVTALKGRSRKRR
jgi:hypothetical protein